MITRAQLVISQLKYRVLSVEHALANILGFQRPLDFNFTLVQSPPSVLHTKPSPQEVFDTSILWAVPKSRKSIEKRVSKKFGWKNHHHGVWKLLVPRTDLTVCNNCGYTHHQKTICGNCYAKIKEETTKLQDKIVEVLGLNPIEKEVVVLYKGDGESASEEFHKTQTIVEVEGKRPPWFSKNLLQKSTQKPSDSTDVKPSELG